MGEVLYLIAKNTVFYGTGKEGELLNTAILSSEYRFHLIDFSPILVFIEVMCHSPFPPRPIRAERRWED